MLADRILAKLDLVREIRPGRWLARCPAHDDQSPSLSVREADGKMLVYCFAQCSVHDVLAAVGLEPADLFPSRESVSYDGRRRPQAKPVPARDILTALGHEFAVVMVAAADLARGEPLSRADLERVAVAHSRFRAAMQVGGVR